MRNEAIAGLLCAWFLCLCPGGLLPDAVSAGTQADREDGKQVVLTESERAWVQSHPVVYWSVDPYWPPFSSVDAKGGISGIDVEIVTPYCRH